MAEVVIEVLDGGHMPTKATEHSAGYDLYARGPVRVQAHSIVSVPCGFRLQMPAGYEAQIRSRSGLAREGVTVANSPGTIDSDYRGEVCVLLRNDTNDEGFFDPGDRIAQMVFQKLPDVTLTEGPVSDNTKRGAGGFGSTGIGMKQLPLLFGLVFAGMCCAHAPGEVAEPEHKVKVFCEGKTRQCLNVPKPAPVFATLNQAGEPIIWKTQGCFDNYSKRTRCCVLQGKGATRPIQCVSLLCAAESNWAWKTLVEVCNGGPTA